MSCRCPTNWTVTSLLGPTTISIRIFLIRRKLCNCSGSITTPRPRTPSPSVFGGVPSEGNITYDSRLPINASMSYFHILDNLSYVRGTHTFKFGIYAEKVWNTYGHRSTGSPSGTFDFTRDPNNPGDANWPYAT